MNFKLLIYTGIAIGIILSLILVIIFFNIKPINTIESKHKIKPKIELYVKNNKIDTLYIYSLSNK